jgi:Glyoxalase/Bleomycin resistance protein/Dioxygenase superfamily
MGEHPLRHADLWHTGIVVDDLDAAKEELGAQLGLTWFEGGGEVQLRTDDGVRTVRTGYALSREGPHHVELCRSVEGTFWTATSPGHAHHLGYWTADVVTASASLSQRGMPLVGTVGLRDSPPICAYHRARNGLYVEVVGTAWRRVLLPDEPKEQPRSNHDE